MKQGISSLLFVVFLACATAVTGQNDRLLGRDETAVSSANDAEHPCITDAQYAELDRRCAENRQIHNIPTGSPGVGKTAATLLEWPLKPAAGLHDCSYYHIAAYVDQNTAVSAIQDWNCGTNTYDGHRGTDISTWPFNFYKMDNDLVEVVAAASGTIIDKHDGEFDRNCTSNNMTANYVIVQHADGSTALYWHMKSGSITSVAVGQPVNVGDHLGVVGSSGSSSGPHLHFEVWSGSTNATRNDPFAGSCNTLNASTWWVAQHPHMETAVVRASVHTTDIVTPGCPTTETLNEGASFTIPYQGPGLPPGYAKFYIFIRDEVSGLNADLSIIDPNGGTYLSWTYNSTSNNKTRTWGWSKVLPTISGTYTFRAVYNGVTCESTFDIAGAVAADAYTNASTKIYPNPSHGKFVVETYAPDAERIHVRNLLGEEVYSAMIEGAKTEIVLMAPQGIYIYEVTGANHVIAAGKLLAE